MCDSGIAGCKSRTEKAVLIEKEEDEEFQQRKNPARNLVVILVDSPSIQKYIFTIDGEEFTRKFW